MPRRLVPALLLLLLAGPLLLPVLAEVAFVRESHSRYHYRRDYWVSMMFTEEEIWRNFAPYVIDMVDALSDMAKRYPVRFESKGLVVVVSDLMKPEGFPQSFRTLGALGHELRVVPALRLVPAHGDHVVGEEAAEAGLGQDRGDLLVGARRGGERARDRQRGHVGTVPLSESGRAAGRDPTGTRSRRESGSARPQPRQGDPP